MFELGDHVRIKKKNVIGEIIDIYKASDGLTHYNVESDNEGPIDDPEAWNDVRFPQFDCIAEQLERI